MIPEPEPRVERPTERALALAFEALRREGGGATRRPSLREWLEHAEAWQIAEALRETGGNRTAAARLLGIGRRTLYAKLDKLGRRPGGPGEVLQD